MPIGLMETRLHNLTRDPKTKLYQNVSIDISRIPPQPMLLSSPIITLSVSTNYSTFHISDYVNKHR